MVHLSPAFNVGDADMQGFDPPFKFKLKLVESTKEIFDTFRLFLPMFFISTYKGAAEFPGVTRPKLYEDGKICMEVFGAGELLEPPSSPPPPEPHPKNVMENSSDVISINLNIFSLIINPPFWILEFIFNIK